MERREFEFTPSYQYDPDSLNSKLATGAGNRLTVIRGLTDLPLAYNSPAPKAEVPTLPDNRLREGVYRVGLDGFAKTGGPKWP